MSDRKWIVFIGSILLILAITILLSIKPEHSENAENKQPVPSKSMNFTLEVSPTADSIERVEMIRCTDYLLSNDPAVNSYKSNIIKLEASRWTVTQSNIDYKYKKFGWEKAYYIQITFAECGSNSIIPNSCEGCGNTMHYFFGNGRKTGYEILKGWGSDMCSLVTNEFIDVDLHYIYQ